MDDAEAPSRRKRPTDLNARTPRIIISVLLGALTVVSVTFAVRTSSLQTALDAQACPPSKYEGATYHGQFYEDYVLAQVFAGLVRGTFIDVGANHPVDGNVSAYFYARGWQGITIDPVPDFVPLYERMRPRGRHLSIGVGETEGKLTFHRIFAPVKLDTSGFSTFDDAEAAKLARLGYLVKDMSIEVATLDSVLAKYPLGDISFLNVDVEGFEKQVLKGIDLRRRKPTVVMLEAMLPRTEISDHLEWEGILFEAGYVFAMSDGLNRYYLHRGRLDLLPRFIHADMCVKKSKLRRGIKMDGWRVL
jgi:FkbM family methyltransferase